MKKMKEKSFEKIYRMWYEDKRCLVKQSSMSTYSVIAESYLIKTFGQLTDITENHIQSFVLEKLSAGFSQKSVKDMLMVLRMILRYGGKNRMIQVHPWEVHFPHPTKSNSAVEVLSLQDQQRLTDYLKGHLTPRNIGLLLCLSTGMRIGEICALRWGDISLSQRIVRVSRTVSRVYLGNHRHPHSSVVISSPKTVHSIREIPLARNIVDLLAPFARQTLPTYYILSNSEKIVEPYLYRSYYQTLLRRLELPDLKFHGLRHTFATRCVESQCDVKTLSTLLGHANISTTMNLYVHPTIEQKRTCIERMMQSVYNEEK